MRYLGTAAIATQSRGLQGWRGYTPYQENMWLSQNTGHAPVHTCGRKPHMRYIVYVHAVLRFLSFPKLRQVGMWEDDGGIEA